MTGVWMYLLDTEFQDESNGNIYKYVRGEFTAIENWNQNRPTGGLGELTQIFLVCP